MSKDALEVEVNNLRAENTKLLSYIAAIRQDVGDTVVNRAIEKVAYMRRTSDAMLTSLREFVEGRRLAVTADGVKLDKPQD